MDHDLTEKTVADAEHTTDVNAASGEHHSHHSSHGEHHSSHGEHSSSHHYSHHHHKHGHKSSKKKKITISSKNGWMIVAAFCVFLIVCVAVAEIANLNRTSVGTSQSGTQNTGTLSVEVINPEGVLVKEAISKFLLTDLQNASNWQVLPSTFRTDYERLDVQVPAGLKVSAKDCYAVGYKIELADNDSFKNAEVFYIEATSGSCTFEHLYTNCTYYYRVTLYTSTGKANEPVVGYFKTADTPRILSIDGLSNVRDIGNWKTESGQRIKQGLLIRGTEMDAAVESGYYLTNEGLVDMLEVFGIKMDMDLRAETLTSKDALGAQVIHKYYDMVEYDAIFTEAGKEKVRAVFADLSDPDNYPIYLHCTYGRDRTGTVCYLLEALLGVSRGDCLRDYALSNSLYVTEIMQIENGLKSYEGNTLKEQTEAYLLSCGVTEYQINSIRNIFLGE